MATSYKGVSFPFRITSGGSVSMTELTPDDYTLIMEKLEQIWGVRAGELIMHPEYGNRASFNFESIEDETEFADRRFEMERAAELFLPMVTLNGITYSPHPTIPSAYIINVDVLVNKYQSDVTLTIPTQTS
ncbi:hypothetical protein D1872_130210 [compost metagenome]